MRRWLPWRSRRRREPVDAPRALADDLPKRGLVAEPVAVQSIEALPPESLGGDRVRVTFWVNVRDAAGRGWPDLAVEARISGPERSGSGTAHTDRHGQVRFRMTGPRGTYTCAVLDIAAGALDVQRDRPTAVASLTTRV